ncbi:MAG: DegV family protein [Eubacteriales bacterium]|nr:DegV family protein [Eubacteriales bacterium]
MKICITADSTCDIPKEQALAYDIDILPLSIVRGEEMLRDGLDIMPDDIFQFVQAGNPIPKTTAVNVSEYREVFERRLRENDAILHINLGAEFSSCYSNALQAAEGLPVYCVDSRNLSLGSGHLVLEAVRMRDAGNTIQEIVDAMHQMIDRLETSFIIDRLDYLWKGGRCSAVTALGANLLKLRPCIELKDGRMGVAKKYRGTYERCVRQYLADKLREPEKYERVILGHTGVDKTLLDSLAEYVRNAMGRKTLDVIRVGCTITSHCGENTVGLFLVRK